MSWVSVEVKIVRFRTAAGTARPEGMLVAPSAHRMSVRGRGPVRAVERDRTGRYAAGNNSRRGYIRNRVEQVPPPASIGAGGAPPPAVPPFHSRTPHAPRCARGMWGAYGSKHRTDGACAAPAPESTGRPVPPFRGDSRRRAITSGHRTANHRRRARVHSSKDSGNGFMGVFQSKTTNNPLLFWTNPPDNDDGNARRLTMSGSDSSKTLALEASGCP